MCVVASKHQIQAIAVVVVEDKAPVLSYLISLLSCFKCGIFRGLLGQIDVPLAQDPESTKLAQRDVHS